MYKPVYICMDLNMLYLMNKIYLHVLYVYINAYIYIYIYICRYRYTCKKLQQPSCSIGLHKADLMQQNSSYQYAIRQNHKIS